jgi:hypothetical protein
VFDMNYTKIVTCRLSEKDKLFFDSQAKLFDLTRSEYLRLLMQLPVVAPGDNVTGIVLDTLTMLHISRELIKWGYHYNQAVHALNTLVYRLRHGQVKDGEVDESLAKVSYCLGEVRDGQMQIKQSLVDLTGNPVLFN